MYGKRWLVVFVAAVLVVGVSACGDGDDASPTTAAAPSGDQSGDTVPEQGDEPATDAGSSGGNGLPEGGEGHYTVDGEAFEAPVYRCDPTVPGQDPTPDDLNVLAFLGGSEGLELEVGHSLRPGPDGPGYDATILFVYHSRIGAGGGIEQFTASAATGPDGQWYRDDDTELANPLAEPAFTIEGNHIIGSLAGVEQEYPEGDATVDVTFDFEIPDEIIEGC